MKNEIINRRCCLEKRNISKLPDEAGVYFLFQRSNILVYIGKAICLSKRVIQHDKEKEFSRIEYEVVHCSRARALERQLLDLYMQEHGQLPYYNKRR
jgi:excinuclease UvrABC nuclease subunit